MYTHAPLNGDLAFRGNFTVIFVSGGKAYHVLQKVLQLGCAVSPIGCYRAASGGGGKRCRQRDGSRQRKKVFCFFAGGVHVCMYVCASASAWLINVHRSVFNDPFS